MQRIRQQASTVFILVADELTKEQFLSVFLLFFALLHSFTTCVEFASSEFSVQELRKDEREGRIKKAAFSVMSMSSYIKQEMVERSEQEEDLNITENLRSFLYLRC